MIRPDVVHELNRLLEIQRRHGYKRGWSWYKMAGTFAPFSELELQYIAQVLEYQSQWVRHRLREQQEQQVSQLPRMLQQCLNLMELDTSFTLEALKHTYRRKALQCHPDVGGSNEEFVMLQEAYKYLKNYLLLKEAV